MKEKTKMPLKTMMELRQKLNAGVEPEALLKFAEAYGYDLDDLRAIQADARHGADIIRIGGGSITIQP